MPLLGVNRGLAEKTLETSRPNQIPDEKIRKRGHRYKTFGTLQGESSKALTNGCGARPKEYNMARSEGNLVVERNRRNEKEWGTVDIICHRKKVLGGKGE